MTLRCETAPWKSCDTCGARPEQECQDPDRLEKLLLGHTPSHIILDEPLSAPTHVIGFAGLKRSGKDTAAKVLTSSFGFTRLAFGDPLKAMLAAFLYIHDYTDEMVYDALEGDLKESPCPPFGGRSPRYAMQTLGTEWGRNLMKDSFWTDALKHCAQGNERVVVTDVRFPNEVDAIREMGGSIFKVVRPGLKSTDSHVSEAFINDLVADHTFINDGTLADLQTSVLRHMIERGFSLN